MTLAIELRDRQQRRKDSRRRFYSSLRVAVVVPLLGWLLTLVARPATPAQTLSVVFFTALHEPARMAGGGLGVQ